MPTTRTADRASRREARRTGFLDAAVAVFTAKGVDAATVDDIVRAAGVAKGTFYLYFDSKDGVISAVAERVGEHIAERVEIAAGASNRSPIERLLALSDAVREVGSQSYERDLVTILHRPENRAVHDRMSGRILMRLAPALASIIADGVARGLFRAQDPRLAAAFVMGSFTSLDDVVGDPDDLPAATAQLNTYILRGLGYAGEVPQ
jgi:AcrR family transcriptional regulator